MVKKLLSSKPIRKVLSLGKNAECDPGFTRYLHRAGDYRVDSRLITFSPGDRPRGLTRIGSVAYPFGRLTYSSCFQMLKQCTKRVPSNGNSTFG